VGKDQLPVTSLETEHIRKVFPSEARHFTTWLEQHIEALADRLGLELANVQREQEVGNFSVDLLCEDSAGRRVIIENQLERTDHDHLGKLLTYLVNLEAGTAVWITPEPRPEHTRVINWLNEATPSDIAFYLVKAEAVRIGGSPYAPLFTILAGPDLQAKEIGEKKKEWAERHYKRVEFWKGLLEKSKAKTKLFANISPGPSDWIATGSGRSGVSFVYSIKQDWATIELYIDFDHETGQRNKTFFDTLYGQKEEIEKDFGGPLDWERLDNRRASRIRRRFTAGGLARPDTWGPLQDEMINGMIRFDASLRSRVAKVQG
jgi:hypothetical protein